MDLRQLIIRQFEQVAQEQKRPLAKLTDDVPLLDTGLDSLCFAIVVARIEDEVGLDPFAASDEVQFPVTVGDFIKCYEDAAK
jgi:Phosphopantetheine attachment site